MSERGRFSFRVSARPQAMFETPLVQAQLEEADALCEALAQSIAKRRAEHPGEGARSTVGGWHSDFAMMQWGGEAARSLAQAAVQIAQRLSTFVDQQPSDRDWGVAMWANVLPAGGLNHAHVHPGHLWSAVFYIDPGDASEGAGGEIYFEDPRYPMMAMRDGAFRFAGADGKVQEPIRAHWPKRAELLVFPAWLRHGVRPYHGARERISIAMNIDAKPREPRP